ncbi:GGDEF domain-containing protein [Pseudoteredinibacter isoporae]|uniref:GGDEF domain-containing protein n=1 Tax=Pseudoteredinibacter isoporae TaxID=570281 RepID=UPI00310AB06D
MAFYDDSPHRRSVIRALSLFTAWGGVVFVIVNSVRGLYLIAGIEFVAAMVAGFSYYQLEHTRNLKAWCIGFILCFYSIMMFILFLPNTSPTVFVWIFSIPLISYLTLGSYLGLRFTAAYLALTIVVFLLRFELEVVLMTMSSTLNVALCCGLIWVFSHIYEINRERSQAQLMKMAAEDSLTAMYNRLRLAEIFEREVRVAQRNELELSLLLIDIDHFKQVNDCHGHDVGDRILVGVADLIRQHSRQTDYGFRVGGEEFCLILSGAGLSAASKVAESLRGAIEAKQFQAGNEQLSVTVSIGVAEFAVDAGDLDDLYRCADQRLYQAKTEGRNQVIGERFEADLAGCSA